MAFRKTCLAAIGGFDLQFRVAGDDVDVCWRLQERGWTIGFHPAAMVWHHRRNSIRAYWRQQLGYGRAEAMLERKWPEKYNGPGYVRWSGRLYGPGRPEAPPWRRARVYHGIWGVAPYQSLYEPAAGVLGSLPQMPDWHLATAIVAGISALGFTWAPLRGAVPLLGVAVFVPLAHAGLSAARAPFRTARPWRSPGARRPPPPAPPPPPPLGRSPRCAVRCSPPASRRPRSPRCTITRGVWPPCSASPRSSPC